MLHEEILELLDTPKSMTIFVQRTLFNKKKHYLRILLRIHCA